MDTLSYKTKSANVATVQKEWFVVDATDQVVGRMCTSPYQIGSCRQVRQDTYRPVRGKPRLSRKQEVPGSRRYGARRSRRRVQEKTVRGFFDEKECCFPLGARPRHRACNVLYDGGLRRRGACRFRPRGFVVTGYGQDIDEQAERKLDLVLYERNDVGRRSVGSYFDKRFRFGRKFRVRRSVGERVRGPIPDGQQRPRHAVL